MALSWGGGTQQFWIQRRYLELITVSGVYSALTDVPIAHSESACRPQGGGYALCIETLHGASWSLPEPTVAGDPEDSEHKAFLSSLFPGQGPMHMAMAKAGSLLPQPCPAQTSGHEGGYRHDSQAVPPHSLQTGTGALMPITLRTDGDRPPARSGLVPAPHYTNIVCH